MKLIEVLEPEELEFVKTVIEGKNVIQVELEDSLVQYDQEHIQQNELASTEEKLIKCFEINTPDELLCQCMGFPEKLHFINGFVKMHDYLNNLEEQELLKYRKYGNYLPSLKAGQRITFNLDRINRKAKIKSQFSDYWPMSYDVEVVDMEENSVSLNWFDKSIEFLISRFLGKGGVHVSI